MMNMTVTVENPPKTPTQLASQFALGVYGLSLTDFAKKIIKELQEEQTAEGC
ncbi:hypothetical protein [Dehalobacter sp. 4CP]|uniref:hypothetical protein n=1 Tax=Dehalobacter sp. CP TaxID=2594474 RepID=UPI0039ECF2A1